jgi:hypothetical protein
MIKVNTTRSDSFVEKVKATVENVGCKWPMVCHEAEKLERGCQRTLVTFD